MGSPGEEKGRAEQEPCVDREWKQTWAMGQGHVECGKCSTSDASALSDIACADGLRRKITARGGGRGRIRKGPDGKRGGGKKKCVCNELLPSDKSACRLFSPFSNVARRFLFQCCKAFYAYAALTIQI